VLSALMKLLPVIVTRWPAAPLDGLSEAITGAPVWLGVVLVGAAAEVVGSDDRPLVPAGELAVGTLAFGLPPDP
jgi:hypothetical protein